MCSANNNLINKDKSKHWVHTMSQQHQSPVHQLMIPTVYVCTNHEQPNSNTNPLMG